MELLLQEKVYRKGPPCSVRVRKAVGRSREVLGGVEWIEGRGGGVGCWAGDPVLEKDAGGP